MSLLEIALASESSPLSNVESFHLKETFGFKSFDLVDTVTTNGQSDRYPRVVLGEATELSGIAEVKLQIPPGSSDSKLAARLSVSSPGQRTATILGTDLVRSQTLMFADQLGVLQKLQHFRTPLDDRRVHCIVPVPGRSVLYLHADNDTIVRRNGHRISLSEAFGEQEPFIASYLIRYLVWFDSPCTAVRYAIYLEALEIEIITTKMVLSVCNKTILSKPKVQTSDCMQSIQRQLPPSGSFSVLQESIPQKRDIVREIHKAPCMIGDGDSGDASSFSLSGTGRERGSPTNIGRLYQSQLGQSLGTVIPEKNNESTNLFVRALKRKRDDEASRSQVEKKSFGVSVDATNSRLSSAIARKFGRVNDVFQDVGGGSLRGESSSSQTDGMLRSLGASSGFSQAQDVVQSRCGHQMQWSGGGKDIEAPHFNALSPETAKTAWEVGDGNWSQAEISAFMNGTQNEASTSREASAFYSTMGEDRDCFSVGTGGL